MRGLLTLTHDSHGWLPGMPIESLVAVLAEPSRQVGLLPPLRQARVITIEYRGIVIQGIEHHRAQDGREITRRQAWWCRPVLDTGDVIAAMPPRVQPRPPPRGTPGEDLAGA